MRVLAAILILAATSDAALGCSGSDGIKYKQFLESDKDGDEKLSYEEHYAYEQKKMDIKRNNAPGPVAQFFDFGGDVHEDHYIINEDFFKAHWFAADKNKDGFWSAEEFMGQSNGTSC